jgi:AraC family transcriptional regulator
MTTLEKNLQPQFIIKNSFTVVGLRITTKPKSPEIPKLWDAFVPRIGELQNVSEPYASYGVMASTENGLDYMAGNPVNDATDLPEGMSAWDISENTYAVFESTVSTLPKTFDYIFGIWLPNSEYKQGPGPLLERYGENFSPENPVVDIYIPVQKADK